jgi:hypothetical protein
MAVQLASQILAGVGLVAVLIAIARRLRREAPIYRVVLAVTAAYYVLAAWRGGTREALLLELGGLVLFGGVALAAWGSRRLLLAAGWAGHALWDVGFHTGGRGAYVPEWYPLLCVAFDLLLAGYLCGTALRREA